MYPVKRAIVADMLVTRKELLEAGDVAGHALTVSVSVVSGFSRKPPRVRPKLSQALAH
jgi:hypothetical protein